MTNGHDHPALAVLELLAVPAAIAWAALAAGSVGEVVLWVVAVAISSVVPSGLARFLTHRRMRHQ